MFAKGSHFTHKFLDSGERVVLELLDQTDPFNEETLLQSFCDMLLSFLVLFHFFFIRFLRVFKLCSVWFEIKV